MNAQSLIPTPLVARSSELAAAYLAMQTAAADLDSAATIARGERGNLCEDPDFLKPKEIPEWLTSVDKYNMERKNAAALVEKLALQQLRRTVFYGARLRVVAYIEASKAARKSLNLAVNVVREAIETHNAAAENQKQIPELQIEAAMFNTQLADRLAFETRGVEAKLSKEWDYGFWDHRERRGHTALHAEHDRLRREWLVKASGHGSRFIFGTKDEVVPEGPYLTIDEATEEAINWILTSDTIGGDAQLYNVRTGETRRP